MLANNRPTAGDEDEIRGVVGWCRTNHALPKRCNLFLQFGAGEVAERVGEG